MGVLFLFSDSTICQVGVLSPVLQTLKLAQWSRVIGNVPSYRGAWPGRRAWAWPAPVPMLTRCAGPFLSNLLQGGHSHQSSTDLPPSMP